MNKVFLSGRLTKDPVIRATTSGKTVANYTLAVDRPQKDQAADFINCVAWEKTAEFAEKYMKQGRKYIIEGRIQTGSYKDKDGKTVYTTDIVVERQEFADSKQDSQDSTPQARTSTQQIQQAGPEEWMDIPDTDLPFN